MDKVLEIAAVLIVCGTFALLVWLTRSLLVTPVLADENTTLQMVIAVRGNATSLESTVQSLAWLRDDGKIPMELIVCDVGLTDDGKRLVQLAGERWDTVYCTPDNLQKLIGDTHGGR